MRATRMTDDEAWRYDADGDSSLGFLPPPLKSQCRSLIQSYHDVHGFSSLPDILWKSRLGPFIERDRELGPILKKASTTRSAKKARGGFVEIAASILSLEILASGFLGWSARYPGAGDIAQTLINRTDRGPNRPLLDFYLSPPKYLSTLAAAKLVPPVTQVGQAASGLSGQTHDQLRQSATPRNVVDLPA